MVSKRLLIFTLMFGFFLISLTSAILTIQIDHPNNTIEFWEGGKNMTLLTNVTSTAALDTIWYRYGGINTTIYIANKSLSFTNDNNNGLSLSASTTQLAQTILSRGFAIAIDGPSTDGSNAISWRLNGNPESEPTSEGNFYSSSDSGTTWDGTLSGGPYDGYYEIINNGTVFIEAWRLGSPGTINMRIISLNSTNDPDESIVYSSGTFNGNSLTTSTSGQRIGVNLNLPILQNFTESFNITDHINTSLIVGANESDGAYSGLSVDWDYNAFLNNKSQNSTIYETGLETFTASWTLFKGLTFSTLRFLYDGTSKTVTQSGTGNITSISSFFIPTGSGQKDVIWNFTLSNGNYNFTNTTLTQSIINLSICGSSPQNVPFINITYKNETGNENDVSAFVSSSTWYYWLSDSSVNKTLSYNTGTTESLSHAFCFNPPHLNVNTEIDFRYQNSYSQQRRLITQNTLLTNSTTNKVLYLLPTSLGLFTRYQTVDSNGDVVRGVLATVTKVIGSETATIVTGITDDSGLVIFFLNPDDTYSYTFSKSGFSDNTFSLVPNSADTYQVIMGGGAGEQITNGTSAGYNLSYSSFPINSSLLNNTDYTFALHVNGSEVSFASYNITNSSGSQIFFDSINSEGIITTTLNTGNQTNLYGYIVITNNDETITFTRVWTISHYFIGDYSLFRQLTLFTSYGIADWIRITIVVIILTITMIYMSKNETLDTSENKMWVVTLMVWAFSLVGWLTVNIPIAQGDNYILSSMAQQYGIAILTTGISIVFTTRRILR